MPALPGPPVQRRRRPPCARATSSTSAVTRWCSCGGQNGVVPASEALPTRLVEDLGDEATALVAVELDDDIDHDTQQPLDLVHAQTAAGATLADHQRHLLEGEGAAAGVDARDASRMARGGQPDEVEALVAAHFRKED